MAQTLEDYDPITIDMRALIDKILARYSCKFPVFRELLQNSDDAGCDSAEICFKTATHLEASDGLLKLPDLNTARITQWTFRNHGKPFRPQDWGRLPRIALGNPDPTKIGAFGVGFFSVFSVTDNPCVCSGGYEMEFRWDEANCLHYRFDDIPVTATSDLWTMFTLPLREVTPMPSIWELMQFLASSITFMDRLENVAIFLDGHCVGQISKSLGHTQSVAIPIELRRSSPQSFMVVESVLKHSVTINARITLPQCNLSERKDVTVFTAGVDVTIDMKTSKELRRCMKKAPPSHLKYKLTYTGKDEYDQSYMSEQNHQFPSPFQGLCADLDGAMHTRVFIGHATAQTTGMGGHMGSHFIPTVEREWIDFVDANIAAWNRELLYVGGVLCRMVYDLELSQIRDLWKDTVPSEPGLRPSRELRDQLHKRFLHVLKFFTFHRSTPSSTVAELLADSFYGCSRLPLRLLSSVGVREAPYVREFDPVLAKFLKHVPMLSDYVTQLAAHSIAKLPAEHKVPVVMLSDILQDLRAHALDAMELVAFLRWYLGRDDLASNTVDLLNAVTLRGNASEEIRLSSITSFIDPMSHIPLNGPLPLFLIPVDVSKHFDSRELAGLGWKEFTVTSWLQHISDSGVMSANEEYDFTRSTDWAVCVLSTLAHVWLRLPGDIRHDSMKILQNKPCIPTSKGLCCPGCSYLPITDGLLFQHLDLPIVSHDAGFKIDVSMERCLLSLGVRKDPPVQILLDQTSWGNWTVFNLIDYLVRKECSLTNDDISTLKLSRICTKECSQDNNEENIYCRVDELYPPVEIFRKLQLPVIEWGGGSEWRDSSPTAALLYRLGLNRFPPLPKIMELSSSKDDKVQEIAFTYLCEGLQSRYSAYKPEHFPDVEFIPAEGNECTCLRKLDEVYSGTQWRMLGFFVVQEQCLSMPLGRLGVMQHPSASKLLDLLEKSPPPDESTARHWFDVLYDRLPSFLPLDLGKLSTLPIVPTGPWNAPRLVPPAKCYLDQGLNSVLYAGLFVFVNFGARANSFLSACGLKNEVLIEDIAGALVEDPEMFFKLAGGPEGFLVELRKIASQSQDISCDILHKMRQTPALLGVCRKETKGLDRWEYVYRFMTSHEVTIVDDSGDYQLFSDCLFVAPREEVIERFYASLGCRHLSTVIKENYDGLHEIQATEICCEVQSLILERLPLFIQKYTDTEPEVTIPSSPDHLQVKACESIVVSKTLMTKNVERIQDIWAMARRGNNCIELWISQTAERDMYEIVTSLCRLLFGTNKTNATILLEMVLSTDLKALERRGFFIDQISQQQRVRYTAGNDVTREQSAGSTLTPNLLQQSTLATQPLVTGHGIHTLQSQSIGDFQQWMRRNSISMKMPILGPDLSASSSDVCHMLAYNALREVFLEKWGLAYEDATKSITALPSTMGYVAKALAQIGRGEPEEAMQVFDLIPRSCDPREGNLILLIKAVTLFVAREYDTAISRVHDLIARERDDEFTYCCVQVLGKMYLMQGDYGHAVQSLERGQPLVSSCTCCDMEIISLIFGWTFDGLQVTLQRYRFEYLYAAGHIGEAMETFRKVLDSIGEGIGGSGAMPEWVLDLQKKCIEMLETLGNKGLDSEEYIDAIAWYTSALSLNPFNPIDILVKRSKARALNGSWDDALMDANEVIRLDPSLCQGYARKYIALHGVEDYDAAYGALFHLVSNSGDTSDEEIRRLRANYDDAIIAIDDATGMISRLCPLVLIDLAKGQLCDGKDRCCIFKSEISFKKLVSEAATMGVDRNHIRQIVMEYFKWVMLSHTWEGEEPTFEDVTKACSVHNLDRSSLDKKLRQFCETARKDGYRWAWSDTCCINKRASAILQQSLVSMYSWYAGAAETFIYLADVDFLSSSQIEALIKKSRWMTRAWTLQELLASKTIRFYDRRWKLFDSEHANHKESPVIKQVLSQAMGLPPENITSFQPKHLGVREKLRLASARCASIEEDIAYSLIGIFSSDITPLYGLGKVALGRLLENIVARTGDVTVISWTGTSLPYNSALPDSLAVYSKIPFVPPPMDTNEFDICMDKLRTGPAPQAILAFYDKVTQLPRATFTERCLRLPCVVFHVTSIGVQKLGSRWKVYFAMVQLLGKVHFRTADLMPLDKPQRLVFIHPWLHDLHDSGSGLGSDDERGVEFDVGSDNEWDSAESDGSSESGNSTDYNSAPDSPLHAEPAAQVDPYMQALRLIVRLGRSFNALLLEQQSHNQYKRVAAENEIIIPGVPHYTDLNDIEVRVMEIV